MHALSVVTRRAVRAAVAVVLLACTQLPAFAAARDEFDAVASRPAWRGADAALQRIESDPTLLRIATPAQVDARFGVPTFLWGARGRADARSLAKVDARDAARERLATIAPFYGLSAADVRNASVRYVHDTGRGGVIVAFHQSFDGVDVFRDELKLLLGRDHELLAASGYLPGRATESREAPSFRLPAERAIEVALADFAGAPLAGAVRPGVRASAGYSTVDVRAALPALAAGLQPGPARVKPVLFHVPGALEAGYYVELVAASQATAYVVSATDGQVLFRHGLIESEAYTYRGWADDTGLRGPFDGPQGNDGATPNPTGTTTPIDVPLIAPGLHTLESGPIATNDPWLPPGAGETQGNNVDAYVDLSAPDGFSAGDFRATTTAPGTFDRAYDTSQPPAASAGQRMAGLTQLFYDGNWFHDWYYSAGFDEASGNAQMSNYGRGGVEGDPLHAEGQDYSGLNNANMMTPSDGASPRMQMYVFTPSAARLTVTAPANVAGAYSAGTSSFGPQRFDVTAPVVLVDDAVGTTSDGCDTPFANAVDLAGKIAMIDRGTCTFTVKVKNAQNAGAVGVIIVNNTSGLSNLTGTDATITIPAMSMTQADGLALKAELANGLTIRLLRAGVDRDGSLDNQVVAHEWGHYISNRLIGDAAGLSNPVGGGMGEGWGDFHALLMTVRAEDALAPGNADWSGTYAVGGHALTVTGVPQTTWYYGFRRVPYSTDFTKNALTFKHITNGVPLPPVPTQFGANGANNAEAHNTGEIWCTMLWECYASLLRDSGRLTFDQAQMRMRDYLVAAYKMTPNAPTLTEARDALLAVAYAADSTDFRLFYQAFARRGCGTGAISPDRFSLDNAGVVESYSSGGDLAFVSAALVDDVESCDHDGALDEGETGTLTIVLRNAGTTALNATTATLSSPNPAVTFPGGTLVSFPSSQPFETVSATAPVKLAGASGRQVVAIQIAYDDPGLLQPGPRAAAFDTYGNVDTAPAATDSVEELAPNWAFQGAPYDPALGWRRAAYGPTDHRFHAPDPGTVSDQSLVTPPITIGSDPVTITYSNAWSFENDAGVNYDGGVVELSIDDGASWTDVGAAVTPGYGGAIDATSGNPLATRQAFVKQSPGWPALQPAVLDLGTIYAGKTILVRFRVGADEAAGEDGWTIDDVQVTNAGTPFVVLAPQAAPIATSLGVAGAPDSVACGSPATLTATITPSDATGAVQFYSGATPIGSPVTLAAGQASMPWTFTVDSLAYTITASYAGDACHAASVSAAIVQRVDSIATGATLDAVPNPVRAGGTVALRAHVTPASATGTVTFADGGVDIGTAPIVSGVATLPTTFATIGPHSITALAVGDGCYTSWTALSYPLTVSADQPPIVQVLSPNGGETVNVGSDIPLSWTATDDSAVASVTLELSRDHGATWETIAADIANTGTYTWTATLPGTNTDATPVYSAILRVTATDAIARTAADTSDAGFSIFDLLTPTVVTRLDATASDAGIAIAWSLAARARYTSVAVERAPAAAGPWLATPVETTASGDVTTALDRTAESGRTYWYRLVATSPAGARATFGPVQASAVAPRAFALSAAYPNPTRGPLRFEFTVPRAADVSLSLVDLQGREVERLVSGRYAPGRWQAAWDGRDAHGQALAPGLYFARLRTPDRTFVRRVAIAP